MRIFSVRVWAGAPNFYEMWSWRYKKKKKEVCGGSIRIEVESALGCRYNCCGCGYDSSIEAAVSCSLCLYPSAKNLEEITRAIEQGGNIADFLN